MELEAALRAALARGAVAVVESPVHELESRPRPDLGLLDLLRELSGGRRLPAAPAGLGSLPLAGWRRRSSGTSRTGAPAASDAADLDALALALEHCELVGCDAFMADVVRRTRLALRHDCEIFSGRRADVLRLRDRLETL